SADPRLYIRDSSGAGGLLIQSAGLRTRRRSKCREALSRSSDPCLVSQRSRARERSTVLGDRVWTTIRLRSSRIADRHHRRDRRQSSAHVQEDRTASWIIRSEQRDREYGHAKFWRLCKPAISCLTTRHDRTLRPEADRGCRELTRPKCVTKPPAIAGGRR